MEIPLKLKWLGKETGELCDLLAPFHPVILVSSAPHLRTRDLPAGFIRLPHKICRVLNLRRSDFVSTFDRDDLTFDVMELQDRPRNFSPIYEFYFEVYLRNSALQNAPSVSNYYYLEPFYSNLLEGRFIVLIRCVYENRMVAGLLLRHPTAVELDAYRARLSPGASIAIVDVLSTGAGSKHVKPLVRRASDWARDAGYSFLSSLPANPIVTDGNEIQDDWILENENITVWQEQTNALLYCDLRRCLYFSNDIYFYSFSGDELSLHYVANVLPCHSGILRLLNSTSDLDKRIYTRHAPVRAALSAAGIECEFLNQTSTIEMVNS